MGVEAPAYPWSKGKHSDYECFVMEVEVCRDREGDVWSSHHLQDKLDEEVIKDMPTGGLIQSAHALLIEAMKKEALCAVLTKMSNDEAYAAKIQEKDPKAQEAQAEEVATAILKTFQEAIIKFGPPMAQATLEMIRSES